MSSSPLHLEEKRKKDKQGKAAIIFPSRKWEKGREEWGNEGNGKRNKGRERRRINKGWERGKKGGRRKREKAKNVKEK